MSNGIRNYTDIMVRLDIIKVLQDIITYSGNKLYLYNGDELVLAVDIATINASLDDDIITLKSFYHDDVIKSYDNIRIIMDDGTVYYRKDIKPVVLDGNTRFIILLEIHI